MATFKYRAKESSGKTAEGLIDASTSDEAIEKINALGLLPVKVEEATSSTPEQAAAQSVKRAFLGRVKSKDITAFGRELASLTKSGVPILKAIAMRFCAAACGWVTQEMTGGAKFGSALDVSCSDGAEAVSL